MMEIQVDAYNVKWVKVDDVIDRLKSLEKDDMFGWKTKFIREDRIKAIIKELK